MDLTNLIDRKKLIDEIKGSENEKRRSESLKQVSVFNDQLFQYVYESLSKKFSANTVREMPAVSSINLTRRIVKQEASVYREAPDRRFSNLDDSQLEVIGRVYSDANVDSKMKKSNESFKLQNQNHIMLVPKDGKIEVRSLRNHHIDPIPDPSNPEKALGYIISSFDKSFYQEDFRRNVNATGYLGRSERVGSNVSDGNNQKIADPDDYKSTLERYVVWTKDFNFIMNGKGEIVSDIDRVENPIAPIIPIVEVSIEKDFEYWVQQYSNIVDFTIDYNCSLSSLGQVVHMQGFAQAYMIAPEEMMAENLQIGVNSIIKLPLSPGGERPEFGYTSPTPDLSGSINYVQMLLANFLSSRGVDPDLISSTLTSNAASSGVQELLRMIKQFTATRDDFSIYENAEMKMYEVIKAWLNLYSGTDILDRKYWTTEIRDSELSIVFSTPEMVKTEQEKIDSWNLKIEAGFASRLDAIMDLYNMSKEEAEEKILEIDGNDPLKETNDNGLLNGILKEESSQENRP